MPEDLENINFEENKYESWGRSRTASLFYIFRYLFAVDKRNGSKSFYRGVPRSTTKSKMELFLTKVNRWMPLTFVAKSSILDFVVLSRV